MALTGSHYNCLADKDGAQQLAMRHKEDWTWRPHHVTTKLPNKETPGANFCQSSLNILMTFPIMWHLTITSFLHCKNGTGRPFFQQRSENHTQVHQNGYSGIARCASKTDQERRVLAIFSPIHRQQLRWHAIAICWCCQWIHGTTRVDCGSHPGQTRNWTRADPEVRWPACS